MNLTPNSTFKQLFGFAGRLLRKDNNLYVVSKVIIKDLDNFVIHLTNDTTLLTIKADYSKLENLNKSRAFLPVNENLYPCVVALPCGMEVGYSLVAQVRIKSLCEDVQYISHLLYPAQRSHTLDTLNKVFSMYAELLNELKKADKTEKETYFETFRKINETLDKVLQTAGVASDNLIEDMHNAWDR